jgi:hypothetical protein
LPSVSDGPLFSTDRANKHGTDGVGTEKARVRIEKASTRRPEGQSNSRTGEHLYSRLVQMNTSFSRVEPLPAGRKLSERSVLVAKKMSELRNEDRASLSTGAEASPVSTDLGKSGGATIGWSERAKKT